MTATLAVDFEQGFSDAWGSVAEAVPKVILFLVILVVGYLIAKAVEKILDRVLVRVGFDRWVERGGIARALQGSRMDAAHILGRVVFYALMLVTLSMAFGVFGPNPVSDYLAAAVAYLPKVFVAIVIVVIAAAIAAAVRTAITSALGGLSYGRILGTAASALVIALGVFAALDQLEIAPMVVDAVLYAALAAIVGVTIVAVGGGGIEPMRERWRSALRTYDEGKDQVMAERSSGPVASTPWSQDDPRLARRPVASAPGSVEEPGQAYDLRDQPARPRTEP